MTVCSIFICQKKKLEISIRDDRIYVFLVNFFRVFFFYNCLRAAPTFVNAHTLCASRGNLVPRAYVSFGVVALTKRDVGAGNEIDHGVVPKTRSFLKDCVT